MASFFVSRVDTEIDKRLEKIGTDEALALRGKAGVANARLAYARVRGGLRAASGGPALAAQGARPQRPLWASTGVKNPDYSDTLYVTELVAPTRSTPCRRRRSTRSPTTARSTATRSPAPPRRRRRCSTSSSASASTSTDVFLVLEDEGVEKFEKSWQELLDTVKGQLDAAK